MKFLLAALMIFSISINLSAQSVSEDGKTYITKSGIEITKGSSLTLGTGTMPNGDFKYINTSSMMAPGIQMNAGYNGMQVEVKKIIPYGEALNRKYFFKIYISKLYYTCDIEAAIACGEIILK